MRSQPLQSILIATLCGVLALIPTVGQAWGQSQQNGGQNGSGAHSDNAPQNETEPVEIDLSPAFDRWNMPFKGQLTRDTCAVFTITAALEYGVAKNLDDGVNFSEEYLNWAANNANGDRKDGATFSELQRGFTKWGIAGSNTMPYRRAFDPSNVPTEGAIEGAHEVWALKPKWNWLARDKNDGLTPAHLAAIKRVLSRGYPVCAGGEHCMLIVAIYENWEGGGTFLARDYARQRYETLTYADVQRRFQSLLWIEVPTPQAPSQKQTAPQ